MAFMFGDDKSKIVAGSSEWLDLLHPVGSIYMSVDSTDPSELFGGTWTQIRQRYLYATTEQQEGGETGGNAYSVVTPSGTVGSHTLTVSEIPAHTHRAPFIKRTNTTAASGSGVSVSSSSDGTYYWDTQSTGGGQGHTHDFTGDSLYVPLLPQYYAVNVWRRDA